MPLVAQSCTSSARSVPKRAFGSYAPPAVLEDLHILDFLELAGSQARAGAALAMHQSTVCRSVKLLQRQLRLIPREGPVVCKHGHNSCLHYLRLAYREHRLMEGLLRIGTDLLHQSLLAGMEGVQQVPAHFRSGAHWAELVRLGLLDGAIVSSFSLENALLSGHVPRWEGVQALPLGEMDLLLMASVRHTGRVLLPRRASAPLLHRILRFQGYAVEAQPKACQDANAWIKRARDRQLALPISPALVGQAWLDRHGLVPLAEQPALVEQLWLVLPPAETNSHTARQCARQLRRRMRSMQTMQDLHEIQS